MSVGARRLKRMSRVLGALVVLTLVLSLLAPVALAGKPVQTPGVPAKGQQWAVPSVPKGLVAVSQPLAAQAGAEMLARGGNAIDAAAAIQFALNVEEPMMTGIGGGCFIMIYLANQKKVVAIDSRERAPAYAKPDQFFIPYGSEMNFSDAVASGLSVGVPGTLMGTATALKEFGTMSLSEVMQPAIKMADEGITVTPFLANSLAGSVWKLSMGPGKAYSFFKDDGTTALQVGDVLVQKDLANTFKMIAKYGIDAYYKGTAKIGDKTIPEAIADIVQARGGPMQASDIQTYEAKWRTPITGEYRGWEIASMAPPSSGGLTVIQMLMMLERFPIGKSADWGHNSPNTLSAMIEAMRLAFADRAQYMGDSDFVSMPMRGLLNPDYVATRSALIDPMMASPSVTYGDPWEYEGAPAPTLASVGEGKEGSETTHFVATDKWGNVVSWTTTIESGWGSGIMVPGYGFMLNNEMTDFNFTPGGANEMQPFKRPRSSMSPTILLKDGKPWMATGSPGGSTIINTVLQMIMNVIDHGMTVQEAVDAPRISKTSASYTGSTSWEAGIPDEVRAEVESRGFKFSSNPTTIGSAQSLVIDLQTGKMFGAGDARRNGTVIYVKGGEKTPQAVISR